MKTPQSDLSLTTLVSIVNETKSTEIAVTLTTKGGIITGNLVSALRWAELNSELLAAADISSGSEALIHFFDKHAEGATEHIAAIERVRDALEDVDLGNHYQEALREIEEPSYIHLKNAHYVVGSAILPTGEGTPWRGRLSEVIGWTLGELRST
ncbi:hypothetical protein ACFV6F_33605 [Kitasatospora phosalacinea]|uniref:hypothetical protein n=1 Tax=Kitasatospora phosalacinea TaxID=2065 RepID=UPI0036615ECC